jgi:hypothetical protein
MAVMAENITAIKAIKCKINCSSAIDKRHNTCHNILVNMKREREKTLWV